MPDLSCIIPARNEKFLSKTIKDILAKAVRPIEVIAVLEEYWPDIIDDPRVHYIHFTKSRGMRGAINAGVALARSKHILKCDGHVMFERGFDDIMISDSHKDWVQIPRRKRLEPETWTLLDVGKPDVDYMFLTYPNDDYEWGGREFSGREWREKNRNPELKANLIDDCMSFQGSCWFMEKDYFNYLELMDDQTYGPFWKEAQEIGFKTWLSGGRVVVNKKTWYAHLHKGKKYGRGYNLDKAGVSEANANVTKWLTQKMWSKQKYPMSYLIKKFPDAPMWTPERIEECTYELN